MQTVVYFHKQQSPEISQISIYCEKNDFNLKTYLSKKVCQLKQTNWQIARKKLQ